MGLGSRTARADSGEMERYIDANMPVVIPAKREASTPQHRGYWVLRGR
jgi:hypothetical protein